MYRYFRLERNRKVTYRIFKLDKFISRLSWEKHQLVSQYFQARLDIFNECAVWTFSKRNIIFSVFKRTDKKSWFISYSSPVVNPKGRYSECSENIYLYKSLKIIWYDYDIEMISDYLIVFRRLWLRCAQASLELRSKILKKSKSLVR